VLTVTAVAVLATVKAGGVVNEFDTMRLALVENVPDGVYITWIMFGAHTFSFICPVAMIKFSPSATWLEEETAIGAEKALIESRLPATHAAIDLKGFIPSPFTMQLMILNKHLLI
jgi:hypothetical protein